MNSITSSEAAKAIVRQNTEEVQGRGNFDVFDELFADDFIDHTPQPGMTPDKACVRTLYTYLRVAFPDFHAKIHWQLADGDRVTTYKTYYGTHRGPFLGVAPTHRKSHFETVDVIRIQNCKITDHWGVANLLSLMQQVGGWFPPEEVAPEQPSKIDYYRSLLASRKSFCLTGSRVVGYSDVGQKRASSPRSRLLARWAISGRSIVERKEQMGRRVHTVDSAVIRCVIQERLDRHFKVAFNSD